MKLNSFSQVDPYCFSLVLEWIYTGHVKADVASGDDLAVLARQCRLHTLKDNLDKAMTEADSFGNFCSYLRIRLPGGKSESGSVEASLPTKTFFSRGPPLK